MGVRLTLFNTAAMLLQLLSSSVWEMAEAQVNLDLTTFPNMSTTTVVTTTLPANPGAVMYVIIPVAILVGVPLVCSGFLCIRALVHCIKRSKQGRDSRRVTPINDKPDYNNDDTTKIHSVNISQDPELITYDQVNGRNGLEAQPNYNYGWDF